MAIQNHSEQEHGEPFSDAYATAGTRYVIASALLLARELIGIDLCQGLVSTYGINISVKTPQAAPWVLMALVLYFGFRLIVEWNQSDAVRRKWPSSRIDSLMAHVLGLS